MPRERPYGAAIDVKEIEYVSALHQTSLPNLRKDGSISATDVRMYLRSKYGLDLSHDDASDLVRGLGGPSVRVEQIHPAERRGIEETDDICTSEEETGRSENSEGRDGDKKNDLNLSNQRARGVEDSLMEGAEKQYYFNLIQMTSIILIPALLQAANDLKEIFEDEDHADQDEAESVSTMGVGNLLHYPSNILRDATQIMIKLQHYESRTFSEMLQKIYLRQIYSKESETAEASLASDSGFLTSEPDSPLPTVNDDFVRRMLVICGENDAAKNDSLVQEMVRAAGGPGVVFDEHALGRALTFDVSEWAIGAENDHTTSFFDVFGFEAKNIPKIASSRGILDIRRREGAEQLSESDSNTQFDFPPSSSSSHEMLEMGSEESRSKSTEYEKSESAKIRTQLEYTESGLELWIIAKSFSQDTSVSSVSKDPNNKQWAGNNNEGINQEAVSKDQGNNHNAASKDQDNRHKAVNKDEGIQHKIPHYKYQAASLDRVVDTYQSILLEVLLWLFYIFMSVVHVRRIRANNIVLCDPSFGCYIGKAVGMFIFVGLFLSFTGLIVIVPVSIGASASSMTARLLTILLVLVYSLTPLIWDRGQFGLNLEDLQVENITIMQSVAPYLFRLTVYCSIVFGCLLAILLIVRLCPRHAIKKKQYRYFRGDDGRTAGMKLAAIGKVYNLMNNALNLHYDDVPGSRIKALSGNVLNNFVVRGSSSRKGDGKFAIWKKLLSSELITKEGVWIHSRLIVGIAGQIAVFFFLIVCGVCLIRRVTEKITLRREKYQDFPEILYETPEAWMIVWSFVPGGIAAIISGLFLLISYVPSTVTTILDLRSGVIPTFHDPKFLSYRKSADAIYFNLANMIFAFIGSTLSFFLFYTAIFFLSFWPPTKKKMRMIGGTIIGLFIVVFLKVALMLFLRKRFYLAFYRKRPAQANISAIMMEAWHVGLGWSVLLVRMLLFVIAAGFWIGRIDQTFLADNVRFKSFGFDAAAMNYRKELLVHDAHRHPFLERLGAMYLMRLKHGNNFSSDAGACWRSVFVVALMPWLIKYRRVVKHENCKNEKEALYDNTAIC